MNLLTLIVIILSATYASTTQAYQWFKLTIAMAAIWIIYKGLSRLAEWAGW